MESAKTNVPESGPQRTPDRASSTGTTEALTVPTLQTLQRTAGNRAVTTLVQTSRVKRTPAFAPGSGWARPGVASSVTARSTLTRSGLTASALTRSAEADARTADVRRVLDPTLQASWDSAGADKVISGIETVIGRWKSFRGNPDSWSAISKIGSCRTLVDLLEQHPEFRQHAAERLRASITYLQELAGFLPDWRLLIDVVPGVTWKDPKHSYSMTASEKSVINAVGYLPVQVFQINYTNAYGWKWTRDVSTTGVQWSIAISAQSGVPGANIGDLAKGEGKDKFKRQKSVSYPGQIDPKTGKAPNPFMPEFAEFNILNAATAKPVKYWGFNDFSGGGAITNGPSVSGKFGPAGSAVASTGGMLKLHGNNGDLDFTEFKSDVKVSPTGSLKDTINAEFKASLASVGVIGMTPIGQASDVSAPAPTKKARKQSRTFGYTLQGFEVDSPTTKIPEGMISAMRREIDQMRQRADEDEADLAAEGIVEPFRVEFMVEGFASRGWASAHGEKDRLAKNLALSQKRADYVNTELQSNFGGENIYEAVGRGAALVSVSSADGPRQGDVIPESDPKYLDDYVERKRLKWIDDEIRYQMQNNYDETPADKIRERVEAKSFEEAKLIRASMLQSNPETATSPVAQRVNITIRWNGHLMDYGAAADAPAPAAK